ncbi:SDR family oxidoreductase [Halobacillus sp. B29]|uniref:SDR family oxidoreductase n=1 Tax=Halobacillus sp. B29 TaxID=3457432 RepID=UPI003FCCEF80
MTILVTGFTGKVGHEVAKKLKTFQLPIQCAVRDVEKAKKRYGDEFDFVELDLSKPKTFERALSGIDRVFLMYPPGEGIQFEQFVEAARLNHIQHIVYLSLKDVQYMPFVPHYKNEKTIKKSGIPYTFVRAGYFMQNLNDFLRTELRENHRIFVPAGKGKTSFVDARDVAHIAAISLKDSDEHRFQKYVVTGTESFDFFEVASQMTQILKIPIHYENPTVKQFKKTMLSRGVDEKFVNVVVGVHAPTKLGLAGGIKRDYEKVTHEQPASLHRYIMDYQSEWITKEEHS